MPSVIRGSDNLDSAAAAGLKAWANFNGTTATIRAAYNVTSVTRNSTGDYTVNFTNAMADSNYAVVYGGADSGSNMGRSQTSQSTTQFRLVCRNTNNAGVVDDTQVHIAVYR